MQLNFSNRVYHTLLWWSVVKVSAGTQIMLTHFSPFSSFVVPWVKVYGVALKQVFGTPRYAALATIQVTILMSALVSCIAEGTRRPDLLYSRACGYRGNSLYGYRDTRWHNIFRSIFVCWTETMCWAALAQSFSHRPRGLLCGERTIVKRCKQVMIFCDWIRLGRRLLTGECSETG